MFVLLLKGFCLLETLCLIDVFYKSGINHEVEYNEYVCHNIIEIEVI